jgi:hypothetical protein
MTPTLTPTPSATFPAKVIAAIAGTSLTAIALTRTSVSGARAVSSCTLDGSLTWWLTADAPTVSVSSAGASGDEALSVPWTSTARPSACAIVDGALVVAVANASAGGFGVYVASSPSLPGAGASPTWTSIGAYAVGGNVGGFAVSADGLTAFFAVRGVGVVAATRATAVATAFSDFTVNTATAPSSDLVDVLLSATERALYVLTDGALAVIDLGSGGAWANALLVPVASASGGARFAGLALSQ